MGLCGPGGRSAKVSLSGDGRFDPSQCPRATAPVTGAGRMFHICSQRSGFQGATSAARRIRHSAPSGRLRLLAAPHDRAGRSVARRLIYGTANPLSNQFDDGRLSSYVIGEIQVSAVHFDYRKGSSDVRKPIRQFGGQPPLTRKSVDMLSNLLKIVAIDLSPLKPAFLFEELAATST